MMSDGFLYDIVQSKSLNASGSIPHHAAVICLIDVIFFSTTLYVQPNWRNADTTMTAHTRTGRPFSPAVAKKTYMRMIAGTVSISLQRADVRAS